MQKSRLTILFVIVFIDLLGFSLILPLLPYYAETFGATPFQIGLLVASYAAAQLIGAPLLGRLSDRFGRKPVLVISLVGTLVGFLLLGFANSLWMLFASRLLDGFTGGNISAAKSRLDFDMEDTVDKEAVNAKLQALVAGDHAVSCRWITDEELDAQPELVRTMSVQPPRGAGKVRLLEIEGVDLQPCGGTHLNSTAEVGNVRVGKVDETVEAARAAGGHDPRAATLGGAAARRIGRDRRGGEGRHPEERPAGRTRKRRAGLRHRVRLRLAGQPLAQRSLGPGRGTLRPGRAG